MYDSLLYTIPCVHAQLVLAYLSFIKLSAEHEAFRKVKQLTGIQLRENVLS